MPPKPVCIVQESPANALALNKDNTQVVIAGRNVFKIFSVLDDKFEEVYNLRVGKNLNLNFSCNDVTWNLNDDHLIATAATNGAVVLWNLNKVTRSKQEHVFTDHKRTVNKVSFHTTEPMWLISGSQDGTMKCFDLRIKEAAKTFYSNTESVRDVEFSPHQQYTFAAVSENGHVQQWDMRRPDRYFQHFTAHSGPIFACDWHPENQWLSTASRDKTIKIWDLTQKPTCEYTIHTIASVGRVKWRPQRKYHIASCALVVDSSINVWDIRRPYIPFASFNEHKDVTTGIAWRGDPHSFISTSRDCTLYHHAFQEASRPANQANPQGLDINPYCEVGFANKVNTNNNNNNNNNTNATATVKHVTTPMRKSQTNSDSFCSAMSTVQRFTLDTTKEPIWFVYCAKKYMLNGRLSDICDHNSKVAADGGRIDICYVWKIIKSFYADPLESIPKNIPDKDEILNLSQMTLKVTGVEPSNAHENEVKSLQGDGLGGVSGGDDETETDEMPENLNPLGNISTGYKKSLNGFKRKPKSDFIFGEFEFESLSMEYNAEDYIDNTINDSDWSLPKEAFPLRHEIQDRSPPPEQFSNPADINDDSGSVTVEDQPCHLIVNSVPKPKLFDHTPLVEAALMHHVSIRDVQTSVSILMALGSLRKSLNISTAIQESWLLEYIDLLGRFKLYDVATQIIQNAWIPSISQLNQQSTIIHASCTTCGKAFPPTTWFCDQCNKSKLSLCSICHQVVRGLYTWCQGCTHGGHIKHMKDWFQNNRQCPTGCGHMCEYI